MNIQEWRRETAGQCYLMAFMTLEALESQPRTRQVKRFYLCHGIFTQVKPPHLQCGHGWVEMEFRDGRVLVLDHNAPGRPISQDFYYREGKIDKNIVKRYRLSQAKIMSERYDSYGPWDEVISAAAHAED